MDEKKIRFVILANKLYIRSCPMKVHVFWNFTRSKHNNNFTVKSQNIVSKDFFLFKAFSIFKDMHFWLTHHFIIVFFSNLSIALFPLKSKSAVCKKNIYNFTFVSIENRLWFLRLHVVSFGSVNFFVLPFYRIETVKVTTVQRFLSYLGVFVKRLYQFECV